MHKFTVIGYYEESGQLFAEHVTARDAMAAFAVVAEEATGELNLIVALPGHLSDGGALTFPGESVVSTRRV